MRKFSELVQEELRSARDKFQAPHSDHEAYALLLEEVDKAWDMVKKYKESGCGIGSRKQAMLEELVQIAAMAQRWAEDIGYIE